AINCWATGKPFFSQNNSPVLSPKTTFLQSEETHTASLERFVGGLFPPPPFDPPPEPPPPGIFSWVGPSRLDPSLSLPSLALSIVDDFFFFFLPRRRRRRAAPPAINSADMAQTSPCGKIR